METSTNLNEYIKTTTQKTLAQKLGITQGAVSQMLRSGRNIVVREYADGSIEVCEIKLLRSSKGANQYTA